jgi:TolB-like protein/class 3 adenylate cyclase/Tfp pilus assembly protein PilF
VNVERRHAAILSADARGYSRLMADDEVGTVRMLIAYRAVMRELITNFHGRVVDTPGDNLLAEFSNAVDAVECALAIQQTLREQNAGVQEHRRLEFRIGVNVGDVVVEGSGIYGDAVNVAARLEALSDAGGLCVSGLVHDLVAPKLPVVWEFFGARTVKNIDRPVQVYRARLPGSSGAPSNNALLRPSYRPSIAVLPFRELGVGEEHHYFADGIVEDIIGALATLPDLFVISRNSTARFRGGAMDVASVGRDLSVRYVLSGSIRRAGDRIRIASELADTDTESVLWSDRVEGHSSDLFELQDKLAQKTVTTIAPSVQEAEIRRAMAKRPESLNAYDFTLRGLDLLYRLRRSEFDRAREMFEKSIAADPSYAAPYALTAIWYSIRFGQGWSTDLRADFEQAGRFAEAALERDPLDSRALALGGHVRAFIFHDYEGAFALFDRALAASPNSSLAWIRSSPVYSYVGEAAEGKRRAEIGIRLSPFDPHLFYAHTALGLACYTSGDLDEAAMWCRRAMAQNPNFTANLRFLAAILGAAGRPVEARDIARALLEVEPDFHVDKFCESYAYKDPSRRAALAVHLKNAGLPA